MIETNGDLNIYPLGDSAITVNFGKGIHVATHKKVHAFTTYLENHSFEGMVEYVPSYTGVTIFYDPIKVVRSYNGVGKSAYEIVCSNIEHILLHKIKEIDSTIQREIEIPVCYGGEYGPDLEFVAKHNQLLPNEVIEIHSSGKYLVYMIGFAPGFPYLGGMSEKISAPRRPNPRILIPKGSVGIAGNQTGVYSLETPGGWQLIGRTPLELFLPCEDLPSLLQSGDIIRFKPITIEEYLVYEEAAK